MDLLILRHGQSEWNARGKWQGQADPPLTDLGKRQAETAAHKLLGACHGFDKIVSSDLQRARRTAEIIAQVTGGGDISIHMEFRERDAGVWQGLTRSEIETSWPNAIADQRWPEGYESDDAVVQRVMPCLERLSTSYKSLLVVGHAGLIRALDRFTNAEQASITNHLSGRWYQLGNELLPGKTTDFSDELLDHDLE